MTARILVICTGNVCRSPVAATMLGATLEGDFEVFSRGTFAQPGQPVSTTMTELLRDRMRLEPPADGAQRLTPSDVERADLVLGLERDHRSAAVGLYPGAVRRAFTLAEFSRLLTQIDTRLPARGYAFDRLEELVQRANQARRPVPPAMDNIDDPMGLAQALYEAAFDRIRGDVERIVQILSRRG